MDTDAILEWNLPQDPLKRLADVIMKRAQAYDVLAAQMRPRDVDAFSVNHCQANIWRAAGGMVLEQIKQNNF